MMAVKDRRNPFFQKRFVYRRIQRHV